MLNQLLQIIDRRKFQQLEQKYKPSRRFRKYNYWSQFSVMSFAQITKCTGIRQLENQFKYHKNSKHHLGLKSVKRSTIADANNSSNSDFFKDLYYQQYECCKTHIPKHKFRFKNKLLSLDATTISLCLSLFPWAEFRHKKGAVKLHLLLDHDGYLPSYAYISNGKKHESTYARKFPLAAGSIITMDRGYTDYKLYSFWTAKDIYFVTRLKTNASYEVLEERPVPQNRNILSDEIIKLTGNKARKECRFLLRRVVVWDARKQREITLLTNHYKFGATTISAIYKDRWQIELFFKAIKQNLRIKTFVGTTENALNIQIWTALIAMLLIKFLQLKAKFEWSLSNLVAFLRWNLFTYKDLWEWINKPFETIRASPQPVQMQLPMKGL